MPTKIFLSEDEIPRQWYNLAADLPGTINPPLGQDGKPISPDMLAAVFPMNLIEQEVSQQRWIDIPEGVLDLLYRWRPSPLHRAVHLEKALDLEKIAREHTLSGGSVMNVIRYASLQSLKEQQRPISLNDVLNGIKKEYAKEGKTA